METDAWRVGSGRPVVVAADPGRVLRTLDERVLTAAERRRTATLRHPADRESRSAAYLLVRWCAALLTGRELGALEVVQRCPTCGSPAHGRPAVAGLPGLHLSVAHARGAVAAGAGWRPVGVDVERVTGRDLGSAAWSMALTTAELGRVRSARDPATAFLRHWVRKECLVKAGLVTLDALPGVELEPGTADPGNPGRTVSRYGPAHVVDWVEESLDAVVAAAGFEPVSVSAFPGVGRRTPTG